MIELIKNLNDSDARGIDVEIIVVTPVLRLFGVYLLRLVDLVVIADGVCSVSLPVADSRS